MRHAYNPQIPMDYSCIRMDYSCVHMDYSCIPMDYSCIVCGWVCLHVGEELCALRARAQAVHLGVSGGASTVAAHNMRPTAGNTEEAPTEAEGDIRHLGRGARGRKHAKPTPKPLPRTLPNAPLARTPHSHTRHRVLVKFLIIEVSQNSPSHNSLKYCQI